MLGAAASGPPGSIAKGARVIQRWVRHHGVEVVAHDGSGLSYTDRISTTAIVRLLSAADSAGWGSALRSTLPSSGQGTLVPLPKQAQSIEGKQLIDRLNRARFAMNPFGQAACGNDL